jgi:hypothetical protein
MSSSSRCQKSSAQESDRRGLGPVLRDIWSRGRVLHVQRGSTTPVRHERCVPGGRYTHAIPKSGFAASSLLHALQPPDGHLAPDRLLVDDGAEGLGGAHLARRLDKEARTMLEDTADLAQALIETGMVLYRKGEYARAREPFAASAPAVERGRWRRPWRGCAATVVTQLSERHGTQVFPVPFAQAPFRIHSDARFSSVM